jgi:hypothetical protein
MLIIVDGYGTIQLYIRIVYDKIAIVKVLWSWMLILGNMRLE